MITKGVVFENCTGCFVDGATISGADVGVEVIGGSANTFTKLTFADCAIGLRAVNSRGLTVADIQSGVNRTLAKALVSEIDKGATFGAVRAKFGDRLKGCGIDLDQWLARLGNAAAVLGLLVECLRPR